MDINTAGKTTLVFNSVLIFEGQEIISNANKASVNYTVSGEQSALATSQMKSGFGFSADVFATQAAMTSGKSGHPASAPSMLGSISNKASVSPMTTDFMYRVLLYNRDTQMFVKTILAKSGEPFSIDVVKGDRLRWYAYSYNDGQHIPEPTDLNDPLIAMSVERDFLYDSGDIDILLTPSGQFNTYPIPIVFKHKVAKVNVKIDATSLAQVSTIGQFKVSFEDDDYLKKGVFSIKNAVISDLEVVPTKVIFSSIEASNIWEKAYYTADPGSLSDFQVNIEDLTVDFFMVDPSVSIVNLATHDPSNPPKFIFTFMTPVTAGQQLTGLANLNYVLQSRRIFHMSNSTSFGYALHLGPGWKMINSLKNFGNLPTSLVKMLPYAAGKGVWIGGGTTDDLSNWANANSAGQVTLLNQLKNIANRPDIIITAYDQSSFNTELQDSLVSYVNAGGVYIMLNEFTSSTISSLLNKMFDTNSISMRSLSGAGAMYPLLQTADNDRVLNGPFGDARGKFWGEDASVSVGVLGLPTSKAIIYSYGQAVNRGNNSTNASAVSMFKHKTKNFFYLGDGGLVSYDGGVSATICPFDFNPITERPIPKAYGNAGAGYSLRSQNAYNGIIAGNVMLWSAAIAEFHGLRPWKYAP